MTGIKPLLIGMLLSGLFAFALISGGIMLAQNNHSNNNIGDDPALSDYKNSLETNLEKANTDANDSLNALSDSPISVISGFAILDAAYSVWKTLKVVPSTIYNLTFGLTKNKIFGSPFVIVFGLISAIILILIIFGIIKLLISGQDE